MMMVHSPFFNFNSPLAWATNASPDSTFDYSAVLRSELYEAFENGEASPSGEEQCGEEQQSSGRRRGRESKNTAYKGVRKRKGGRWVSEIREPGKKSRIWLGTFSTPEMAARAYDLAAFNLKRPYAYVNFPEAVSSLPIPQSRSPKHIQEAASAAAAAFRGAASRSHAGRTGGLVPTSQVAESSKFSSTSSPMPQQQQSSTSSPVPEQQPLPPQSRSPQTTAHSYLDEDLIFNMPNVLADMAEGLMMAPPLLHHDTDGDSNNGDTDGAELSLWDFCTSTNSNYNNPCKMLYY